MVIPQELLAENNILLDKQNRKSMDLSGPVSGGSRVLSCVFRTWLSDTLQLLIVLSRKTDCVLLAIFVDTSKENETNNVCKKLLACYIHLNLFFFLLNYSHVRINTVYLLGRGVFYCLIWLKPSIIHPLDYQMSDGGSHHFKHLDNISLASNTVSTPGRRETHGEEPDSWIWWLLTAPLGCHWPGRALHLQTGSNLAEKHKQNEQSAARR